MPSDWLLDAQGLQLHPSLRLVAAFEFLNAQSLTVLRSADQVSTAINLLSIILFWPGALTLTTRSPTFLSGPITPSLHLVDDLVDKVNLYYCYQCL